MCAAHATALTTTTANQDRVFGEPLRKSLKYASVAISMAGEDGQQYVWGYVPIIVAKVGLFLKEKGALLPVEGERCWVRPSDSCSPTLSDRGRRRLSHRWLTKANEGPAGDV